MTAHMTPSKSVLTKQSDSSYPKNAACETNAEDWGGVSSSNDSAAMGDERSCALHMAKDVQNGIISEEMSQGSESNLKEEGSDKIGSTDSVAVTSSAANSENDCQSPPPKRLPLHEQDLEILSLRENFDHASNTIVRRMDSSLSKESSQSSNATCTKVVNSDDHVSPANRNRPADLSPKKLNEGSLSPPHQNKNSQNLEPTERLDMPPGETREMESVIAEKKNDFTSESLISDDDALPVPENRIVASVLSSSTPSSSNTPDLTSLIAVNEICENDGEKPIITSGIVANHSTVQGDSPQVIQSGERDESRCKENQSCENTLNDQTSVDTNEDIPKPTESSSDCPVNASDSSGGLLNVSTALDHVLSEMRGDSKTEQGKNSNRKRPCVLQQCLVADAGSGTSTPSEESNASSLKVESSMLLSEESLNQIARMTLNAGSKSKRKSVVTFQMDSNPNMDEENLINGEKKNDKFSHDDGKESLASDSSTPTPSELKSSAPIISGTAAATEYRMRARNGNTTGKLIINGTASYGSQSESPELSKPLPPPPQLISCAITNTSSQSPENYMLSKYKSGAVPEIINNISSNESVGIVQKGMDMLADIISHAVPVTVDAQQGTDGQMTKLIEGSNESKNNSNKCNHNLHQSSEMVPVGQSLSVYSAIAAQAGIPAHVAVEKAVVSTDDSNDQEKPKKPESIVQKLNQTVQLQSKSAPDPTYYKREIGKIRRYSSERGDFGDWEDLPFQISGGTLPRRWCDLNVDESIEIPLRRGGRLRVFPNFLADGRRSKVFDSAEKCPHYRQYTAQTEVPYVEPRVHVLLSSQAKRPGQDDEVGVGHVYRGVSVKAKPLSLVPEVESLAQDLADLYRIGQWDIGVDLVSYRNGKEHIPWHSNDTQGEVLILCIVLKSHKSLEHIRPILVKPKSNLKPLEDGDEEIIIFVGEGDAYEMDGRPFSLFFTYSLRRTFSNLRIPSFFTQGAMQLSYEHCLPQKNQGEDAKRSVVVFRHGSSVPVSHDTGVPASVCLDPNNQAYNDDATKHPALPSGIYFGHPKTNSVLEGKRLFSLTELVSLGAHR